MGNDEFGSFDKLFEGKGNAPKITDAQTWIDVIGRNMHSMDNVGNMCYQVFKIRVGEYNDAKIQNTYLYYNECADMLEKSLRTFEFPIEKDRWSLRAMTFTQEDLVQYANVRSEVAGRICTIVQLNELTENDFYAILNADGISPVDRIAAERSTPYHRYKNSDNR